MNYKDRLEFLRKQCQKLVCDYIGMYPAEVNCGICPPCRVKGISEGIWEFTDAEVKQG